jgi:IS30 family transposase
VAIDRKTQLKPGPPGKTSERARYIQLMNQGFNNAESCRVLGIGRKTGSKWRNGYRHTDPKTGRVYTYPAITAVRGQPAVISARYLSEDERITIADRHRTGESLRSIAAGLGRAPSTVSRELRRNRNPSGQYRPHYAQKKARTRRQRPRVGKIAGLPELKTYVQAMLDRWWSPGLICRQLKKAFPTRKDLHIVHETIYQALYIRGRGGLSRELVKCLRTGRDRRKPNRSIARRSSRFAGEVLMISDRPQEASDRSVPGAWEGDLIMGTQNRSAIATLVERSTRYLLLVHMPGINRAEDLRDGLIRAFNPLPPALRSSLTWDQGSEMATHAGFTAATGVPVYFCDPHSPWQRGTNENTNGLLRQYFPKYSDLSIYSPQHVADVAMGLNNRPRRILNDDTPSERFARLLTTHT